MLHYIRPMVLGLALGALALTGCSSESKSTTAKADSPSPAAASSSSPTPEAAAAGKAAPDSGKAALEKAVRAYTVGLFEGAGEGYELVSKRCQAEMTGLQFASLSKQAHHEYGALKVKTLNVDQLSGDLARVSYGVGVPQFERKAQPWTREGGTWKWDACQASGE